MGDWEVLGSLREINEGSNKIKRDAEKMVCNIISREIATTMRRRDIEGHQKVEMIKILRDLRDKVARVRKPAKKTKSH